MFLPNPCKCASRQVRDDELPVVARFFVNNCVSTDADGYLNMAFQADIEVITSREIKVSGALGLLSSKGQKVASVGRLSVYSHSLVYCAISEHLCQR